MVDKSLFRETYSTLFAKYPVPPISQWERRFLERGRQYRVVKPFTDGDGTAHPVGEEWTFICSKFSRFEDIYYLAVRFPSGDINVLPLFSERSGAAGHLNEYVAAKEREQSVVNHPPLDHPPAVWNVLRPGFLASRMRGPEWMDEPEADPEHLRLSLRYLRRINWFLGYTGSTLSHLQRFSQHWTPGETIRIIDIATGSGDVPRAMLKWAKPRGFDLRVVGVDLHAMTCGACGACGAVPAGRDCDSAPAPNAVQIVQANAMQLPFADGSFDYATTSLFLHHLDNADVVKVLSEMGRVAKRGVIVGDLLRHRRAYFWVNLLTLFANPMVRHDGRISVAQAFKREEIIALRDQSGISFAEYHRHSGHRFVLAGERTPVKPE